MSMASRKPSRSRWWIWGLALFGAVSGTIQLASMFAWRSYAAWSRNLAEQPIDRSIFASPFFNDGRWMDPATDPSFQSWETRSRRDIEADLRPMEVTWDLARPFERIVLIPPPPMPCISAAIVRMRLTWRGWRAFAVQELGESEDEYTPLRLVPQWRGPF